MRGWRGGSALGHFYNYQVMYDQKIHLGILHCTYKIIHSQKGKSIWRASPSSLDIDTSKTTKSLDQACQLDIFLETIG